MNELTSLQAIEIRIAEHMNGIGVHMLAIGRCLNDAKDLCPHGEWEAWVQRNTGLKLRNAQELMRAAREIPEGSVMEKMNISMISKILTLPEGKREEVARKAVDEDMTVKQLRAEVDRLKALDERRAKAMEKLNDEYIGAKNHAGLMEMRVHELMDREPEKIIVADPEQEAEIERLREDLAFAEEQAERFSDEASNAKAALLNYQLSGGSSESDDVRTTVSDIIRAAQSFIAAAGVLPHMQARIDKMSAADKDELKLYIDQISDWADGARRALDTEIIELRAAR